MTPKHVRTPSASVLVDRRVFLGMLGVGVVAGGTACAAIAGTGVGNATGPAATPVATTFSASPSAAPRPTPTITASPTPTPTPTPTPPPLPPVAKVPLPAGTIRGIPGEGNLLAWTVDDGSNPDVVRLYTEFAARSGTRLTFFINGMYPAWTQHAAILKPLVQKGQVQIGNHTFDHLDLTSLSDAKVIDQLERNHDFIQNTYGVDARPYYRPPYGFHSARVDALASSIGYTCPMLWYGSLSDSGQITEQQIVEFANQWFLPQHIVIGHLNYLPVTNVFPQLQHLIAERGLRTVTLDDVFAR